MPRSATQQMGIFRANPDGAAAATRSAKLGVRERQHERPVLRCFLQQLAPLPAPRSRESESGTPFRAVCFVARLANMQRLFDAARFAHPIPESRRRGPVEFFNTLLSFGEN
jgi:hypothetical protein